MSWQLNAGQITRLSLQSQAGWGFEQHGLVEGVPAHGRGVEQMIFKGLFWPKPLHDYVS